MQGNIQGGSSMRCSLLENLLYQKLLLHQAEIDSIEVSDSRVESTMDARLRYYINQFGSKEKLEEFYKKSIIEIKDEMRELVRDQMKVEDVQSSITMEAAITPSEVKGFFQDIHPDSLPLINTEYQIGQIMKEPPILNEELDAARAKIRELRKRVLEGENFATLAILYSEDPGSAKKGGELGDFGRGVMYPEFEAAAFSLKNNGDLSPIVKTEAGYHILQLINRKGEYVNVRHILIKPRVSPLALIKARKELDSIRQLIIDSVYSFEEAARQFSDDPNKINGGLLVNDITGTTRFEADQLDPSSFFIVDKLKIGEISEPVQMMTKEGKEAYRLLHLVKRTEPHKANLKDDYNTIQLWALEDKKATIIREWIDSRIKDTYVWINDRYKSCSFINDWN
jgi:peptidyl-prolyl cis-trans isomerase SurA